MNFILALLTLAIYVSSVVYVVRAMLTTFVSIIRLFSSNSNTEKEHSDKSNKEKIRGNKEIDRINREKQNLKKYNNTVVYNHNNYGFTEYGALVKGYAREVIDVEIHEGSFYYIFEGNEFINPFTKKEYYVYNTENIKPITQAEIDREITRQFEEFELLEKKFKEFNENISKYYK